MPARTYEIYGKDDGFFIRDFVCAPNKEAAVMEFLERHKWLDLGYLVQLDEFEVSEC